MAHPSDRATHEPSQEVVSALRVGISCAYETLKQFADRTGVPQEEDSDGAVEWVASRLSHKQRAALEGFPLPNKYWLANEIGAASTTLFSLLDFHRYERDCLAPLMLVSREFDPYGRVWAWCLNDFGLRVMTAAQAMSAGTAKTEGLGAKPASAVGTADAPTPKSSNHPDSQEGKGV